MNSFNAGPEQRRPGRPDPTAGPVLSPGPPRPQPHGHAFRLVGLTAARAVHYIRGAGSRPRPGTRRQIKAWNLISNEKVGVFPANLFDQPRC